MSRFTRFALVLGTIALGACTDDGVGPVDELGQEPAAEPGVPSAQPGVPAAATSARLVFASTRGARWQSPDLYVANGDGTSVTRLTLGESPAWSADARQIAFFREANPYDRRGIYLINADSTGERYLVPGRRAAWSPDGRLAVAQGPLTSAYGGMFVVNADGSGLRHLLERGWAGRAAGIPCDDAWSAPYVDHPAWSPDGQHIAFVLACHGEWSRLYLIKADGTDARLLVDSWQAYAPAWSPDGTSLAATIDGAITTIGYGPLQVHLADAPRYDARLDWSPDGRRIVFEGGAYDETRLYTLTLATGEVSQLIPGGAEYYADFDVAWARVQ